MGKGGKGRRWEILNYAGKAVFSLLLLQDVVSFVTTLVMLDAMRVSAMQTLQGDVAAAHCRA